MNSERGTVVTSPMETVRRYLESLPQDLPVGEEIRSFQFWKAVRTEFLATLLIVLLGCGASVRSLDLPTYEVDGLTPAPSSAAIVSIRPRPMEVPPANSSTPSASKATRTENPSDAAVQSLLAELKISLAFGLTVATLVQCVGNISGGHGNPAVSIAMLVIRNISPLRAVCYVTAQCVGGITGAWILYGLTPSSARYLGSGLGVTAVHPQVKTSQAFGIEFMATLVVIITVMANVDPHRADMGFKSLSIGFAYTVGHFFGYQSTGASMNPARSLGPALIMNSWKNHWVYWVGPILGGIIGGVTYDYTRDSSRTVQYLRRSFRRKHETHHVMKRDHSALSSQETELTTASNDCRI